ncbi:hypothetical protein RDI58_029221 [Solanum bulbocastanum]|uniref:DUF4218 domain-containing protein n=1 Tax=Solanum bulbocastanum TaxID=147425 RepID=A0AAN8Y073_SOLBU
MSTKTSTLMTWHKYERLDVGIMRHPADSMAWKSFDEIHPSFAVDPRSIAEGYIAIECMTLCSRYLHRIDKKFNKLERNYDGGLKKCNGGLSIFCQSGKTIGAKTPYELEADELEQAHIYILKNCDEVLPYLEEFAQTHENGRHLSDAEWKKQFIEWFKDRVAQLYKGDDSRMMEDLLSLSCGPTKYSTHSDGYVINGYRFHVEDYDKKLRTQNCGVVVLGSR